MSQVSTGACCHDKQTVRELLEDHVTLDAEGIDRIYLSLQRVFGAKEL